MVSGDRTASNLTSRFNAGRAFGIVVVVLVFALAATYLVAGRTMLEKSLKSLIAPVGLVWLILIVQWFVAFLRRDRILMFGIGLAVVLLTLAGNTLVSRFLTGWLEAPYVSVDPFVEEKYGVMVVLGGGTGDRPNGHPQLSRSGERVALAAELYHAGRCKQIIVTGQAAFRFGPDDLDPCEEARSILIKLGVPENRIEALQGHNTSEEARAFRDWLNKRPANQPPTRIGLLTSAWHLPRAISLFERQGIRDLHPIPADFMTESLTASPNWVIPGAESLTETTFIVHELLGRAIGR